MSADIGSNNWVIGPSRSVTGHALLANDPHLSFSQPPRWYEIHLNGGRFNVSGVCLAGIPLPVIGQNTSTAWGFTNSMVDDLDFFIEKINPDNKNQYFYEGEWLDMSISNEKFKVKGKQDTVVEIRSTHHGPIISSIHQLNQKNNDLLSMQWTGHWITNELDAWVELTTMNNWVDFTNAVKKFGVPGQNIVYADIEGNIGWRPCVFVPIRKRGIPSVPRPGWDKDYEWAGRIPFEKMPFLYNPPEGVISTANNRIVNDNFSHRITGLWADPSRASRIDEFLKSKKQFTVEDMKTLQLDYTSNFAKEVTPKILRCAGTYNSKPHQRALTFLENWDFVENKDSEGALIFHTIINKIIENIYYDELSILGERYFETYIGLKYITKRNLRKILVKENNKWVDNITTPNKLETVDYIINISIDQAIEWIIDKYGNNWSNWKWGNAHTISHDHLLGKEKILDYLFNLNIGPYTSGGSDVTPNAGGYSSRKNFRQTSGASMRRIVDFSDLNMTKIILPTGQSGIPSSPHYKDQARLYHNGDYRNTYFNREYITSSNKFKLLQLVPKN